MAIRVHVANYVDATPALLPQLAQRRWDTSPYRKVHRLTWARLNRPTWPSNGSIAWKPIWGVQRPLPAGLPREDSHAMIAKSAAEEPTPSSEARPELLRDRLQMSLNIHSTDALALIQRSRVVMNGQVMKRDRWIKSNAHIEVNGHALNDLANLALLAHKPAKCALTDQDPMNRLTYTSLLPMPTMLACPVGRLDFASSGLLVLTNSHRIAAAVNSEDVLSATFLVFLQSPLENWQLTALRSPKPYGEGCLPETAQMTHDISTGVQALRLTLKQGKPTHVRHALAALGAPAAVEIRCVRLGPLSIEEPMLACGLTRPLMGSEIHAIHNRR